MSIGRRAFLRALGLGAASAPVAAKAAVDAEMAALTTLAGREVPPLATGYGMATPGHPMGIGEGSNAYIKMSDYLRVFGRLPDHVERDVRARSEYVHHLDPDIANKRSWSMSVKIATQRQRNYDREVQRYRDMGWHERAQNTFEKLSGFRWQW